MRFDSFKLVNQLRVQCESTAGVEITTRLPSRLGFGRRRFANFDGVFVGRSRRETGTPSCFTNDFELFDGGGALQVGGNEQELRYFARGALNRAVPQRSSFSRSPAKRHSIKMWGDRRSKSCSDASTGTECLDNSSWTIRTSSSGGRRLSAGAFAQCFFRSHGPLNSWTNTVADVGFGAAILRRFSRPNRALSLSAQVCPFRTTFEKRTAGLRRGNRTTGGSEKGAAGENGSGRLGKPVVYAFARSFCKWSPGKRSAGGLANPFGQLFGPAFSTVSQNQA